MNCRMLIPTFLIALLILSRPEIEARPLPSALDSTDRVTYIYDGPPVNFGPNSATVEIEVMDYYNINDVDVLVSIQHTWDSDITMRLVSPDLRQVLLVQEIGGSGHNFTDTYFNDDAATAISDGNPPFTGSFRPLEPLSIFNGGTGTGTWLLHLEDDFPTADHGILTDLELTIGGRIGAVVRGRVTSLATQQPMSGVRVEMEDTPYVTMTNEQGYYVLNSSEGTYNVLVSFPYWCSEMIEGLELSLNDTVDYDFQLGKPEADISNSSLNILVPAHSATNESFTIDNYGNCPLEWSLVIQDDWITTDLMSGTIAGGTSREFVMNVDATSLVPGDYLSRIVITHNSEDSPVSLPVFVSVIALAANEAYAIPHDFALLGSYPNPFNAMTSIRYALPLMSDVRLLLYTSNGRVIKELAEQDVPAGIHDLRLDMSDAASGLYFARLTAGEYSAVQKLVLIK